MYTLFVLQLKSQVRCLECGYVSVRFDPFTFLSLPLPMDSSVYVEVIGKFLLILINTQFYSSNVGLLGNGTILSGQTSSVHQRLTC